MKILYDHPNFKSKVALLYEPGDTEIAHITYAINASGILESIKNSLVPHTLQYDRCEIVPTFVFEDEFKIVGAYQPFGRKAYMKLQSVSNPKWQPVMRLSQFDSIMIDPNFIKGQFTITGRFEFHSNSGFFAIAGSV